MATQVKTGLIANDAITDAKIANVALTGVTASSGDSSTSLATTAFVATEINSLIDSAPGALNTLNELAAAMGDDANFSTTVTNSIATKAPLASPTFTGNINGGDGVELRLGNSQDIIFKHHTSGYGHLENKTGTLYIDSETIQIRTDIDSLDTALYIDASHRVGIGGTPSNAQLDIKSSISNKYLYCDDGTNALFEVKGTTSQLELSSQSTGYGAWEDMHIKSHNLLFYQSNAEKMRIQSDGTTSIGSAITTTYDNNQGYPLHIQASTGNQTYLSISVPGAASGNTGLVLGHDATGTRITNREADPMIFGISSAEKMRIHSSGHVSINGTSANASADGLSNLTVGGGSGDAGISIYSGTSSVGRLMFADGTSGGAQYDGFIDYNHSNQSLGLGTGASGGRDVSIDSTGRVGINRTPSITNSKLEVGGADNVPLINVEASGNTAGIGVGGGQLKVYYGSNHIGGFSIGAANKYNSGNSPGFGGNGGNLRLEGDDSQIIMANNLIHSDNSGLTKFTIRNAYGAVSAGAELSLDGGHIDFRTGTSFSKRMEIASGGGIGIDVPASIRTDVSISAACNHATKRWGFGAGRSASSAPFYTINESNTGVYISHGNQSWTAHSDERIKENIISVGTVLPSLMNMQCVKYNLKIDPGNTKIGFIAQDWESAFPEVVDEQSDMVLESDGSIGMAHSSESTTAVKGLSYTETIPLLLKAIQEQQNLIETLQTKVAALEAN